MRDDEVLTLRERVSCATVLERLGGGGWRLDKGESTRRAPKYRRGEGEILIVSHGGRGWWDPTGDARGDVFALVQRLLPGTSFGAARRALRPLAGLPPAFPEAPAVPRRRRGRRAGDAGDGVRTDPRPPGERWADRPPLAPGGRAWGYLAGARGLPAAVLAAAAAQDAAREGRGGCAWFAHRDPAGRVRHVEVRGPRLRSALGDGAKALFRLAAAAAPGTATGPGAWPRLLVAEAPIEALSLAALEGPRPGTLYLATGGGIGPGTEAALAALAAGLTGAAGAVLVAATDADAAGDRHAARLAGIAARHGLPFGRLRPPGEGVDWNDVLRGGAGVWTAGRAA